MADGMNKVILLGNIGADPELRMTGGGTAILKIRLATSESYLDRNKVRQERTEWHSVVVWGRRAEALAKIIGKGSKLMIEGGLRTTSYDDREGKKRYKTEINADNIILVGGKKSGPQGDRYAQGGDRYAQGGGSDHGQGHSEPPPAAAAPSGGGDYSDADYGGGGDDDIPFAVASSGMSELWWTNPRDRRWGRVR